MSAHEAENPGDRQTVRTSAQIFASAVGAVVLVLGIIALLLNPNFSSGDSISPEGMLLIDVNGWSSLLMIVTGAGLLAGAGQMRRARVTCTAIGALYLVITIWSLFSSTLLGLLPLGDATSIFYAAIAVLSLTAGLAPDPRER